MLTTKDNPYNPYTHFDEWYVFDETHGYHSCSYLAHVTKTSDELSPTDNEAAIDAAIDEIIAQDVLNLYVKAIDPKIEEENNNNKVLKSRKELIAQ